MRLKNVKYLNQYDHINISQFYKNRLDYHNNEKITHRYNQFTWALSRHLTAEELVLRPALKNKLRQRARARSSKSIGVCIAEFCIC